MESPHHLDMVFSWYVFFSFSLLHLAPAQRQLEIFVTAPIKEGHFVSGKPLSTLPRNENINTGLCFSVAQALKKPNSIWEPRGRCCAEHTLIDPVRFKQSYCSPWISAT